MKRKNVTRNALFTSIIAMLLCVSMLVGTTFAWFTDSVTSAGNKVVAGNLDVDLYQWTADGSAEITNESDPLFGNENSLVAQDDATNTLWEPGKTQVVYLSIKNNGSLDLKYKVNVNVKNPIGGKDLYKAMQYAITPDAQFGSVDAWTNGTSVVVGSNETDYNDVMLKAGEEHFFALSVHMMEEAGNEYQNGTVEFDVSVLAGQLASELDSFGNSYDAMAAYPGTGYVAVNKDSAVSVYEVEVRNKDGAKVGTAKVPAAAIDPNADAIAVNIEDTVYEGNITVEADETAQSFDVTVEGLKEDNSELITVQLRIPAGLDPATVKLYHYDEIVEGATYNPTTGYVTFKSAEFSPFTVVYEADSVAPSQPGSGNTDPNAVPEGMPKPTVTEAPAFVNVPLTWKSFGAIGTANSEQKLETVYKYESKDTEYDSKYDSWYCDFYVSVDKEIGEGQLFLGGEYGEFGWVGFDAPAVEANTEYALLASAVAGNLVTHGKGSDTGWTYADIKTFVGQFHCGVAKSINYEGELSGLTFKVNLCLTNPADPSEYYNVHTITYTFNSESTNG